MSNPRKDRGRATEHLVARSFAADGWPYALPTGAGASGRDITGVPGVAVEVKARTKFEPLAAMRQATANAGQDLPVVVLRCNGAGPTTIDAWPAFTTFGRMRQLLRQAGYGAAAAPTQVTQLQRIVAAAAIAWHTASTFEETRTALDELAVAVDQLMAAAMTDAAAAIKELGSPQRLTSGAETTR